MSTPDYEMYTDRGNSAIHQIVEIARECNLTWENVNNLLIRLSRHNGYEEAADTAVRDAVYIALGLDVEIV